MNTKRGPIGVGVAGLGRSGWSNHATQIALLPDRYRIVAVMDPDRERSEEGARTFDCQSYVDYDHFLSNPELELVVVATPSHLHSTQSVAAMAAGKNVVCEKPMTPTLAEADELIAAVRAHGRLLTVFQNRRFMPDVLKIREIISSGVLGRIVKVTCRVHKFARRWDWQTLKAFGGGELNNTASHFVDAVLQFAGDGEPRVFCHRTIALASGDTEDTCTILIHIPQSPLLEVEVSSAAAYREEMWHIQGTRGGLRGTGTELRWKTCNIDELPPRPVDSKPTADRSYNREDLAWREEEVWTMPDDVESSQRLFYKALYDSVRNGAPLAVTMDSVRRQIDILERCRQRCPLPPVANDR